MTISDWSAITTESIDTYWTRIVDFLPSMIGSIVIIIIGILIARLLKWAVITVLESVKIQNFFDKVNFTALMKKAGFNFKAPQVSGEFINWLTIIIFLIPAANILGLSRVATLLDNFISYIPNVAIAVIIILIGSLFTNFIAQIVKAAATGIGATTASVLSTLTRYILYIFIAFAAFFELAIPGYLINMTFTGLIAALAIAFGLSFGLGGQTASSDLIKKIRDDFKK